MHYLSLYIVQYYSIDTPLGESDPTDVPTTPPPRQTLSCDPRRKSIEQDAYDQKRR